MSFENKSTKRYLALWRNSFFAVVLCSFCISFDLQARQAGEGIKSFTTSFFNSSPSSSRANLENTFNIYISPSGQEFINENILDVLFLTGFSLEHFYFNDIEHELEELEIEELLNNDVQMRDLMTRSKEALERFLLGFEIDPHRFHFKGEEIIFSTFWDQFQINFTRPHFNGGSDNGGILATIELEARDMSLFVKMMRAQDKNNNLLGVWGFDDFEISLNERSPSLQVTIPIMIYNTERGQFRFSARPAYSNIDLLVFDFDFTSPITMPRMGISINDYHLELNRLEVENSLRESMPMLLLTAQEMAQEFFIDEFHNVLTDFLNENFQVGGIDMNAMDPPGAPEGEVVEKFDWGIELSYFDFVNNHIHVSLSSFIEDPELRNDIPFDQQRFHALNQPKEPFESFSYDLALGLNKGFVNRLIQLSFERGFFREFDIEGEDTPIRVPNRPVFEISSNGEDVKARLALEIEHHVSGIQSIFVKNPMRIEFDLEIGFPVVDGAIQMVVNGINTDSIRVGERFIRMFRGTVLNAIRKQVQGIDISGMVLVEEFPVPESLGGIEIHPSNVKIDENGHLIIYMDFNL